LRIINDMSKVNIDAELVCAGTELSRSQETLIEMTNGCICCTLRDDLLAEVGRLAREARFNYLLIESTGIAEPLPVAATFDFRGDAGHSLSDVARLDTMVTIVDAANLTRDFSSHDHLSDLGKSVGGGDDRTLANLLTDQIEFADVIVLNKVTAACRDRLAQARSIIRALNPDARLIAADFARVDAAQILEYRLLDFDRAHQYPLWAKELYGFDHHIPEIEEYGISSFVYRAQRPFDPARVHAVLNGDLAGLIRAKGHFWIASRPDWVAEFSLAGAISSVSPLGRWWAGVPRKHWPTVTERLDAVARLWQEPWGDRRHEIVFIGTGMDPCRDHPCP
jgi:G3E family GTPase